MRQVHSLHNLLQSTILLLVVVVQEVLIILVEVVQEVILLDHHTQ
jgi:hypothetical protein